MGRAWMGLIMVLGCWAVAQTLLSAPAEAQLDPLFYRETCPRLFPIVVENMLDAITNDSRAAASLLRVHFHDCFVLGCDASVLLTGDASEQNDAPNFGSLRSFDVIDTIKAAIEAECPNVVSCADVVALASFFGVILSGGPTWVIPLGRRDGLVPSSNDNLIANLPPAFSDLTLLNSIFSNHNLTLTDLVALSGGHTIGDARCISFSANIPGRIDDDRLYNFAGTGLPDPDLNTDYADELRLICPEIQDPSNAAISTTTSMDPPTSRTFDNSYFTNFLTGEQLFISDNALFNDNGNASEADMRSVTRQLVLDYAADQDLFFSDFAESMIKMGNLNVTTGTDGEIRKNCSVPNSPSSTAARTSSSDSEAKSARVAKELSAEEKDEFIGEIRKVVHSAKLEFFAKHFDRVVKGSVGSLHSSQ